jgi:CubicO group peptidase (beta-lactamase class C family)
MHTPQIPIPWNPASATETLAPSYALGWMTDVYRGHWRVHHGGATLEFNSYVALYPQDKTGVVVLINASSPASNILANTVSDLALGLSPIDWTKRVEEQMKEGRQSRPQEKRVEGTVPAHKLEAYAGEYLHPAYGSLTIEKTDGALRAMLHGFDLALEHWHYETFVIAGEEFRGQKLTFQTNAKGEVSAVSGNLEPAVKDIIFERRT